MRRVEALVYEDEDAGRHVGQDLSDFQESKGGVEVLARWIAPRARMWQAARIRLMEDGSRSAWRVLVKSVVEGLEWTYEGQLAEATSYMEALQDPASEYYVEDEQARLKVIQEQVDLQVQAKRILRNLKVHRLEVPLLALPTEQDLQAVEAFNATHGWEAVPVQGA